MNDNTNIEKQFHVTPAVIEARRKVLQDLPFEELAEMLKIQEGKVPGDPQPVVGRVGRADKDKDKDKLIDSIIEFMMKNHNPVTEERYQFVEWLYWIRKQHGNRYGFLQSDFICIIFGKMMVSKFQRTDADIQIAVNKWCKDPVEATLKYGHISKWNTSMVTNMNKLFYDKSDFNDDISKWDVSNVTDMSHMFCNTSFNGDISGWNVSSVTHMSQMFMRTPFDGDISGWDVSSVTDMIYMFYQTSFNGDISGWNVSSVTSMYMMFSGTPFKGDISGWNVSSVTDMYMMFYICRIPEAHKPVM